MNFFLPTGHFWHRRNDDFRFGLFGQDSKMGYWLQEGLGLALLEAAEGVYSVFPHKKSIAILKGQSPFSAVIVSRFLARGFQIHEFEYSDVEKIKAWVEKDKRQILFFLGFWDHPVTHEIYDLSPLLSELNESKITQILVSHASHRYGLSHLIPEKTQVLLLGRRDYKVDCFLGQRLKIKAHLGENLFIPYSTPKTVYREPQYPELVESFEADLPCGGRPFFKKGIRRLYDQAVVSWPQIDGHALQTLLNKEYGLEFWQPGLFCSYSLSSWSGWNGLVQLDENINVIRGLLTIDARVIGPRFRDILESSCRNLMDLGGSTL